MTKFQHPSILRALAASLLITLFLTPSLFAQLPAGGPVGPTSTGVPGEYRPQTYNPSTGQPAYGNYVSAPQPRTPIIYNRNQDFGIPGVRGDNFNFGLFPGLNSGFRSTGFSASALATRFDRSDSYVATERGNYINPQLLGNPQIYLSPYPTTQNANTPRPLESPTANFGAYRNLVVENNAETLFNRTLPAREGFVTGQRLNNEASYAQSIPFQQGGTSPYQSAPTDQRIPQSNASFIPQDRLASPAQVNDQVNPRSVSPTLMQTPMHQIPVPFYYYHNIYRPNLKTEATQQQTQPQAVTTKEKQDESEIQSELENAYSTGNSIPEPHTVPKQNNSETNSTPTNN
ncbi:hypothetical protein JD969_18635 [Planctomycetota bacterium]|nr:hypothetical protein JD969_18635 [Planctomycetota bacterium]